MEWIKLHCAQFLMKACTPLFSMQIFKDLIVLLTVPVLHERDENGHEPAPEIGGMGEFRENSGEDTVQRVMNSLKIHDFSIFA
jgi:hypothetical protein